MKPCVVLQSDFGISTGLPASMTAVVSKVDPELRIYDMCHEVRMYDIRQGGRILASTCPYFADGTVFVSVVDPGVGTTRRSCVAKLDNGSYVVTPDNGTLTYLYDHVVAVREIDETVNRLPGSGNHHTFHGRDVYAYTAARLASGIIDYAGVGPEYPVEEIVLNPEYPHSYKDGEAKGFITDMMRMFGNLETNIPIDDFARAGFVSGDDVHVLIKEKDRVVVDHAIPFRTSFGYVAEGSEVVYNSSDGVIGIGINKGSFLERYNIGIGGDWSLTITKEAK